jgi:hypothetical protein
MTAEQIERRVELMRQRGCRINDKRTEKKLIRAEQGSARQVRMHLKAIRCLRLLCEPRVP